MRPLTTSARLESRSAPGPRIARGKLKLATADEYGRRLCPQSDSNRHYADFLPALVGVSGQQKQVANGEHIACTTRYLAIAGRPRYGPVRMQIAPGRQRQTSAERSSLYQCD